MAKKKTTTDNKIPLEVKARYGEWMRKWQDIAHSTVPMNDDDRAATVTAVNGIYAAASLAPPKQIAFSKSPVSGGFAAGFAACINAVEGSVDVASVVKAVEAVMGTGTGKNAWVSGAPDMTSVAKSLHKDYKKMMECAALAGSICNSGNLWQGWGCFLTMYRDLLNYGETKGIDFSKANHYIELIERSGPRYVHADFCIVSDRPVELNIDDRRRIHGESGPAIKWSDGTAVWAWHGFPVRQSVILGEFTADDVRSEDNAEIRRIMAERMGHAKYYEAIGAKLIHEDEVPVRRGFSRMIKRALAEDDKGNRFLHASDGSTNRSYDMSVPPTAKTCKMAHTMICGLSEDDCVAQG